MWDFAFVFLAIFFFVTFFVYNKKTKQISILTAKIK